MDIQKIKTLIVDDDLRFSELLKKTLESKNCEVQIASDAITALSYLVNEHYHIVFLDCVLKDKNGMEFHSRIKEVVGDSVQIIMMSGVVSSKSLSSYIDLGVFDFLSKPISESEIDINLRKIKDRYIYGKQDNILIKLFKENISQIEALKYLVYLKKACGYEFFLYLSSALATKESIKLEFTLNNKKREVIFNQGNFIDYKYKNSSSFIERLVANRLIKPEEATTLKHKTEEECVKYLISHFILSPDQIVNFKYDLLVDTLKSIYPKTEISIDFQIVPVEKEHSIILTQNEYADIVFLCLKQNFNNEFFPLFDKNLTERHLIFNTNNIKTYLPELTNIIEELKSKIKLSTLYKKHIQDKNIFCFYILHILLKGDVFISDQEESDHNYFYERYKKLEKFITTADRRDLFNIILGRETFYLTSKDEKKKAYNRFLKRNHPDIISQYKLPKKILDQVNQTTRVFRRIYEEETNPNVRREIQKQKKEEALKETMLMTENKKLMERYLEEKKYKSAFSILEIVPDETIDKEIEWQLLIAWLYLKTKRDRRREAKLLSLFTAIQKNKQDLESNKIYYYIVGLNYMNRKNYRKALESFNVSKKLDYSFKPTYEEIKKCSLYTLKTQKKNHSVLKKILNFKTTKKKTG